MTFKRTLWLLGGVGLLGTLLAFAMVEGVGPRRPDPTVTTVTGLASAVEMFHQTYNRYPTQEEGLAILLTPPMLEGKQYPRFVSELKNDAWGRSYQYRNPSRHGGRVKVFSVGADGIDDTEDDVRACVGASNGDANHP